MKPRLFFLVAAVWLSSAPADILIDDFETGTERNNLGWDWYYFSDVPDSGNSVIHDAVHYGDGRYSKVVCDSPGYSSGHCAKIHFTLGTNRIRKFGNTRIAFVGMGTDLVKPGDTIDLQSMDSLEFRARGTRDLIIFIEIVSKDIGSWAYWRSPSIMLTDQWARYSIPWTDFVQPGWASGSDVVPSVKSSLSVAQKFNWQAVRDDNYSTDSAFFDIDDIVIKGVDGFQFLKLITPKIGDVFRRGDSVSVKWVGIGMARVSIAVSYDDGENFTTYLASTPNDSQETIRISANADISDKCILRVQSLENETQTGQSGPFRIENSPPLRSGRLLQSAAFSPPPRIAGSRVEFTATRPSPVNITLQTMSGRIVFGRSIPQCSGRHSEPLPVQDLKSGCYVVRIFIGDKLFSQKVFVYK